jgi:predicted small integral membrane protein
MGAIDTNYTFTATDVITSTKMNNILDQSTITATAVFNSTLSIASGKLLVATGGITSNELAAGAVTTTAITDLNVTTGKIADLAVTTGKLNDFSVTTGKIADSGVTTVKIADANVTAAKLNGAQTGTAPIFAARAFAKIKPNNASGRTADFKSGNYSAAVGSVVTVTVTSHGLRVDDRIRLVFTRTAGTGTVPSSATFFTVTGVTDANVFTVAFTSAAVSSGTVIAEFILIQGSKNVSSASFYDGGSNRYILNFTESMNDVNYTTLVTSQYYHLAWADIGGEDAGETQLNTARNCHVATNQNSRFVNIVVFG